MKTLDDKDPRLQDVSVVPGVTHKIGVPIAAAIIGGAIGLVVVAAVLVHDQPDCGHQEHKRADQ